MSGQRPVAAPQREQRALARLHGLLTGDPLLGKRIGDDDHAIQVQDQNERWVDAAPSIYDERMDAEISH
jgi:hypothetical protein